jgi:peptidoglycan hydrolase-like protein with peptidoglycan-binding domain
MKTRSAMKTWMTALALTAAGTMLATPAFGQTNATSSPTTNGTDVKSPTNTESGTGPVASPGISPGTSDSTTGATGSDIKSNAGGGHTKSGTMGSGPWSGTAGSDARSDAMKSGLPGRSARGVGSVEQVKAVQQALKDKGHDAGDIDGKMGPKTQAALRDFQQKEGLKATGRADAETMARLGVEVETGAGDSSSSSPAASPGGLSSPGSSSSPGAPSGAQSGARPSPADTGASEDATSTGAKPTK